MTMVVRGLIIFIFLGQDVVFSVTRRIPIIRDNNIAKRILLKSTPRDAKIKIHITCVQIKLASCN